MTVEEETSLLDELSSQGVLAGFFRILWQKNVGKAVHTLTGVSIPHTIVYRHRKPMAWYFLSKDGSIKKKNKKRLVCSEIEEALRKNSRSQCGVCAVYISPSATAESGMQCTFVRTAELRQFLLDTPEKSGVLQCFSDPKPHFAKLTNTIYTVNWTPRTSAVEMIANRHCLTDEAADLHERLVMDTGLTVGGVSSHSAKVVLMAADKVAEHIACLYAGAKLIGLTLQFRIDAANTVWLLHCSSVVVSRDRTSHILTIAGARVASLPLRKKQSASQKHHHTRTGYFQGKDFPTLCALCNEHKAKGSCSRVRRGTVLFSLHVLDHFTDAVTAPEVFEEKLLWETGGIPKCIKMLDPRITDEEYAKVKGADWLQGTVVCCYDCLTALIQLTESIKVDKTGDITQPFASKSLPPIAAPPSTQLQALDASSLATSACTVRGGPAAKLSSLQRLPPAACASTSSRVSVRPRTHGTMQQHATAVSSEVLSSHGLSASDTSGAASPPANLVAARRKIRGRIASSR